MVDPAVYPYYQRLTQNPDDAEALYVLWQWYGDRGEFQQLATLVEQVAARRLDPVSAADLFYRAGELWAKNVGRMDKAVGNYHRAFELDPGQIPALEAATAIYIQLGNYDLAAQLIERQLAVTSDPHQRLGLLRQLASLRAQTSDPSGQAAALEEIIQIVPNDYEAMRELAGAYLARAAAPGGDIQDSMRAASLLTTIAQGIGGEHALAFAEAALDAWPGEETALTLVREAYLAAGRREDLALREIQFVSANPASALVPMIRRDLAEVYLQAGQIDDAIEAIAPLAAEGDLDAARTLAELYRQAGRMEERVALLAQLPPSSDPVQRIGELREMAEVYGQHGDRESMIAALRQILAIDPADPEALALVEDELRARNAFAELREVLFHAARAPNATAESKKARLREIALLCEQRLGDPSGAIEAWRALLALDPQDAEATSSLEKLLARTERWDELARWLERRALAATDRQERRSLWERLIELHRRRQDTAAEAEVLRAWWQMDPDDDSVAAQLIDARRRIGDTAGVAEVMQARATSAQGETALQRWSELATYLEQIGETDPAMQAWQQVATLDPARHQAWEAIERLLERTGRHDLLLETLIAHAEGPAAGDLPAVYHARAAELARMLGDLPTAIEQAQRALSLSPNDDATTTLLLDLLEAVGDEQQLLETLRQRASATPDGERKIDLLRRLAQVIDRNDPEEAARIWAELREVSKRTGHSDDPVALEALAKFAERKGDHARLADLLLEASVVAREPTQQCDYLLRRAEILADPLGRTDDALATLREVTDRLAPTHAPTWGRIADLALRIDQPLLAAEALERQLALTEEDEQKAAIAARLVDLCEHRLDDVPRALAALEAWYDADPTDYTVVDRLVRLNERQERWEEVVKYLEVLAEVEGDEAELSAMVLRIADIAEHKLGAPRKAFDVLANVARQGDSAALDALRGVTERNGLETELVPLLEELAQRAGSPEERARLWREVSQLSEHALKDTERALDAAVRSVMARPAPGEDLDTVLRLARQTKNATRAAEALRAVLAATRESETLHDVAMEGIAFLEGLGAAAAALDLALAVQAQLPADNSLLDAIERLAPAAGRGTDMFIAFDRRRNASRDDSERYNLLLRAARAAAVRLGDQETARGYILQAITQAVKGKTPDESKLLRIEEMARNADQEKPEAGVRAMLVDALVSMADDSAEDDPRMSALLARHAAQICHGDLGQTDRAYTLLTQAVSRWPADQTSAESLEGVAHALGQENELVALYQQVIEEAYEPATARAYKTRLASLLGDKLGRIDEAIGTLQELVEMAPRDLGALRSLQSFLRRHSRYQELLIALERELEVGSPERLATLKEIATIWEEKLRNAFEARNAWKQVLKHMPNDADAIAALNRLERRRSGAAEAPMDQTPLEPDATSMAGSHDHEISEPTHWVVDDAPTGRHTSPPPDPSLSEQTDALTTEDLLAPPPDADLHDEHEETAIPLTHRSPIPRTAPQPSATAHAEDATGERLSPEMLEEIEPDEALDPIEAEEIEPDDIDLDDDIESLDALAKLSSPPPSIPGVPPPPASSPVRSASHPPPLPPRKE